MEGNPTPAQGSGVELFPGSSRAILDSLEWLDSETGDRSTGSANFPGVACQSQGGGFWGQPMQPTQKTSSHFLARALRWLKTQIVQEVPPEYAACEFDCPKQQCHYREWANCEYRLAHAEGLKPAEGPKEQS